MKECREHPRISIGSRKIAERMGMHKCEFVQRFTAYEEEKKRNAQRVEKMKVDYEMREFTGRPKISTKSKNMFNDISKILKWEQRKLEQRKGELDKIVLSSHISDSKPNKRVK